MNNDNGLKLNINEKESDVSFILPIIVLHVMAFSSAHSQFCFPNPADKDAQKGKKTARKTTKAGGSGMDLQKIAQEQQAKLEKEREERKEQIKEQIKEAEAAAPPPESPPAPAPKKAPAVAEPKAAKDPEPSKNANHEVYETGA